MNSMKSGQNEESLPMADRNNNAMVGSATAAVAHRCGGLKRGGGAGLSGARPQARTAPVGGKHGDGNRSSSRNRRTQDAGDCHLRCLDQARTGDNFGRWQLGSTTDPEQLPMALQLSISKENYFQCIDERNTSKPKGRRVARM